MVMQYRVTDSLSFENHKYTSFQSHFELLDVNLDTFVLFYLIAKFIQYFYTFTYTLFLCADDIAHISRLTKLRVSECMCVCISYIFTLQVIFETEIYD